MIKKNEEFPWGDFEAMAKLANVGDTDGRQQLVRLLDEHPDVAESLGDMFASAKMRLINLVAGGNQLLAESMARHAAATEAEIVGDDVTALRKMAARNIVLAWLAVQLAEATASRYSTVRAETVRNRAQRRWERSLKMLDLVRRKLSPS
ncbi:MAG: hypothetical protein ABGZ17_20230 [Planctomycetaceae bacterium]